MAGLSTLEYTIHCVHFVWFPFFSSRGWWVAQFIQLYCTHYTRYPLVVLVLSLLCLLPLMPHYPQVYLYTLLSVSEAFLAGAAEWCQPRKECPSWASMEGTTLVPRWIAQCHSVFHSWLCKQLTYSSWHNTNELNEFRNRSSLATHQNVLNNSLYTWDDEKMSKMRR